LRPPRSKGAEALKMPEIAIEARDIHVRYGAEGAETATAVASDEALAGVSLDLSPGELVCVLGPNGAGKSTLPRCLAGTLAATRGEARLFGRTLASIDRRDVARTVAVVSQQSEVAWGFAVRDV